MIVDAKLLGDWVRTRVMRSPDTVMMKHDYKLLMVLREAFWQHKTYLCASSLLCISFCLCCLWTWSGDLSLVCQLLNSGPLKMILSLSLILLGLQACSSEVGIVFSICGEQCLTLKAHRRQTRLAHSKATLSLHAKPKARTNAKLARGLGVARSWCCTCKTLWRRETCLKCNSCWAASKQNSGSSAPCPHRHPLTRSLSEFFQCGTCLEYTGNQQEQVVFSMLQNAMQLYS